MTPCIGRRDFITLLGGAATAWPLAAPRRSGWASIIKRGTGATLGDKQLRSRLLNAGTATRGA